MKIKWYTREGDGRRIAIIGTTQIGYVDHDDNWEMWDWKCSVLTLQGNSGNTTSEAAAKQALSRFFRKFLRKIGVESVSRILPMFNRSGQHLD